MKIQLRRNTPGRARRALAAFSVTEATVGLGVIGICIGALFSGFSTGFFTMRMARENLRATQILLQKTETLRLYNWEQINNPAFVPATFVERYDPNAPDNQGLTYHGTVQVSPAPIRSSYSNDLRQVTVTLQWKTGGINRNRTFTTFVARNGLQSYVY
ncbi:MAG: hypothetical protein RJA22_1022 [Verrucomicrobiota bacterium]|jgi:type II secretory pathway pseudopilin PulG